MLRSDYQPCCWHKHNDCFKKGKHYKHWTLPASPFFFFFFFRSYEATWGSSFAIPPFLIKVRDYSHVLSTTNYQVHGFRLGTHFREDRGRGVKEKWKFLCGKFKNLSLNLDLTVKSVSRSVVSDSWTVDPQTPLSMGFPRQEYWSG